MGFARSKAYLISFSLLLMPVLSPLKLIFVSEKVKTVSYRRFSA